MAANMVVNSETARLVEEMREMRDLGLLWLRDNQNQVDSQEFQEREELL